MKPRKHAEVIKQWADGAQIEYRGPLTPVWTTITEPTFIENCEYRVKPDPAKERAARDMAIALAVRSAMLHAAYTIPGMDALDLAAIIATVKES